MSSKVFIVGTYIRCGTAHTLATFLYYKSSLVIFSSRRNSTAQPSYVVFICVCMWMTKLTSKNYFTEHSTNDATKLSSIKQLLQHLWSVDQWSTVSPSAVAPPPVCYHLRDAKEVSSLVVFLHTILLSRLFVVIRTLLRPFLRQQCFRSWA